MVAVPAPAVVVAPVAGPFMPFAIATVDDFEVGAAAVVDPDAIAVVSPGAVEDAIGFAALADDEDAVARVDGAEIAIHVVRRAIEDSSGSRFPISRDAEIGAAAAVNPDSPLARTPSLALNAGGLAALANHAYAEAGIRRTPGTSHVVGGAVDQVGFAPAAEFAVSATIASPVIISVVIVSALDYNGSRNADLELSAATVIDPDAVIVEAPREVLSAFSLAFLMHHLDAAAGIYGADAAVHVIGVTGHAQGRLRSGRAENWFAVERNGQDKGPRDQGQGHQNGSSRHSRKTDHRDSLPFMTKPAELGFLADCRHGSGKGSFKSR